MNNRHDSEIEHKRQRRGFKSTRVAKGKSKMIEEEAILKLKVIAVSDIDRNFRSVNPNYRFYAVNARMHPGKENYTTDFLRPVMLEDRQLDPVWNSNIMRFRLGELSVEDSKLHLGVIRATEVGTASSDPGNSNGMKIVGRFQQVLSELPVNKVVKRWFGLMQPGKTSAEWKPEGKIYLAMELSMIPFES